MKAASYAYEFAISYSGEDRDYAEPLAACLALDGSRVFYDRNVDSVITWGRDLPTELAPRYSNSRHAVSLLSDSYLQRIWTRYERGILLAEAAQRGDDVYLIDLRLELRLKGEVPAGFDSSAAHLTVRRIEELQAACAAIRQLSRQGGGTSRRRSP